jgi:hypothetical protein
MKILLKPKKQINDMYNISGVHQLKYNRCPLRDVGQTGYTFKTGYRQHI